MSRQERDMSYMVMLIVRDMGQLEAVLDAWKAVQIDHVTFVESVCSHQERAEPPHIPMRFLFESLGSVREQCSFTLFAVVPDDRALNDCMAKAESVVGSFDASGNGMLAAWPLPIVRGYPECTEAGEPKR
jgi:hypothetical protein